MSPMLSPVWDTYGGLQHSVQGAPGRGKGGRRRKDGAWLGETSQASCFPRLGCGAPPCSPMPRSPEECRRLRTCSECLARHPRTLQPGDGEVSGVRQGSGTTVFFSCDWVGGTGSGGVLGALRTPQSLSSPTRHLLPVVSGVPTVLRVPASGATGPAPQRMIVGSIRERSSGRGTAQRLRAGLLIASSAPGRASACGRGSLRGQVRAEAWSLRGQFGGLGSWF